MLDIPNEAVLFDLFYENGSLQQESHKPLPVVSEITPVFRDIHFRNIFCHNAGTAILLNGLPELPLQQIEFDSVSILSGKGIQCSNSEDLRFVRVTVITGAEPVFSLTQSRFIDIQPSRIEHSGKVWMKVNGEKSEDIHLNGAAIKASAPVIAFGENAGPDAVILKNWRK